MNDFLAGAGALVPPIGVGLLFWFVMRAVVRADRREREAIEAFEARETAGPGESSGATVKGDSAGNSAVERTE